MDSRRSVAPRVRLLAALVALASWSGAAAVRTDDAPAQLQLSPTPTVAPTDYVAASDGTDLAVNVRLPDRFEPGRRYPAIFHMDGYEGASGRAAGAEAPWEQDASYEQEALNRRFTHVFNRDYVTVHVSMRGTGCSGGRFELFSPRSDLDGKEVIEWMARQPWSDGRVGIAGHSYSGITALRVASTRPAPAVAVMTGGLVGDAYRDVVYIGGVWNAGFPTVWPTAYRTSPDVQASLGGTAAADATCARNVVEHQPVDVILKPLAMLQPYDGPPWRFGTLLDLARQVQVPTHVAQAFQDHNTGPRGGAVVFEALRSPKRLLFHPGGHLATGARPLPRAREADQLAWFEHWLGVRRDRRFGSAGRPRMSVRTVFEEGLAKEATAWPSRDARFVDLFLRRDGRLDERPPRRFERPDAYTAGVQRTGTPEDVAAADGHDLVSYRTAPFRRTSAIDGPIAATLYLRSDLRDFDLFATVMDEAPDGRREVLQFGTLRAGHRAVAPGGGATAIRRGRRFEYRPHRPHTADSLQPVRAGRIHEYRLEIFPVGRVLRPGHRLVLKVTTPPMKYDLYVFPPNPAGTGRNDVVHDPAHRSRITFTFVTPPHQRGRAA